MEKNKRILYDAISLWWLRPENGLALASYCINGVDIKPLKNKKYADFACGDGVNSFFKSGGRFDFKFDIFANAVSKEHKNNNDQFDYYNPSYKPLIKVKPKHIYAYGTDHKILLLKKASKLNFYKELLLSDLSKNKKIKNEEIDFLYCNSLYWVKNVDKVFSELVKKVKPGGGLVLDVMTVNRIDLRFKNRFQEMPKYWQQILDRGRDMNNPGILSEKGWENLFKKNNTFIIEKRDIFPVGLAEIWNIGLRPIFPILNSLIKEVKKEKTLVIKKDWVETFTNILYPILNNPELIKKSKKKIRIQYFIKKKS